MPCTLDGVSGDMREGSLFSSSFDARTLSLLFLLTRTPAFLKGREGSDKIVASFFDQGAPYVQIST